MQDVDASACFWLVHAIAIQVHIYAHQLVEAAFRCFGHWLIDDTAGVGCSSMLQHASTSNGLIFLLGNCTGTGLGPQSCDCLRMVRL